MFVWVRPLFLLAKQPQEKKLGKKRSGERNFALCRARPKALPLETTNF
jgi:hypothetical protein